MRHPIILFAAVLICSAAWGQTSTPSNAPSSSQPSMPDKDMPEMSHHDMSNMKGMPMSGEKEDSGTGTHVMHSMEGHMSMGPHMKMTVLRQPRQGDLARAKQIVEQARKAAEKYKDHHAALADGFKIFHPEIPQKMYHFTNYTYGLQAAFHFNPEYPTSLLYERRGEDYKLIGVMYTAPKWLTEHQLDERIR